MDDVKGVLDGHNHLKSLSLKSKVLNVEGLASGLQNCTNLNVLKLFNWYQMTSSSSSPSPSPSSLFGSVLDTHPCLNTFYLDNLHTDTDLPILVLKHAKHLTSFSFLPGNLSRSSNNSSCEIWEEVIRKETLTAMNCTLPIPKSLEEKFKLWLQKKGKRLLELGLFSLDPFFKAVSSHNPSLRVLSLKSEEDKCPKSDAFVFFVKKLKWLTVLSLPKVFNSSELFRNSCSLVSITYSGAYMKSDYLCYNFLLRRLRKIQRSEDEKHPSTWRQFQAPPGVLDMLRVWIWIGLRHLKLPKDLVYFIAFKIVEMLKLEIKEN